MTRKQWTSASTCVMLVTDKTEKIREQIKSNKQEMFPNNIFVPKIIWNWGQNEGGKT